MANLCTKLNFNFSPYSQESFVDDDVEDFHTTIPVEDHSKTQTLPKSYKTRIKNKEFESSVSTKVIKYTIV